MKKNKTRRRIRKGDSRTQHLTDCPWRDTVLIIEDAIKNAEDYPTRRQVWQSLSKKVKYKTFKLVMDCLAQSNKILVANDGKIMWIWNPKGIEELKRKGLIVK